MMYGAFVILYLGWKIAVGYYAALIVACHSSEIATLKS